MEHNSGIDQGLSFPFRLEEFYTIRYFSIILKGVKAFTLLSFFSLTFIVLIKSTAENYMNKIDQLFLYFYTIYRQPIR